MGQQTLFRQPLNQNRAETCNKIQQEHACKMPQPTNHDKSSLQALSGKSNGASGELIAATVRTVSA